jgi:hypothetical protein
MRIRLSLLFSEQIYRNLSEETTIISTQQRLLHRVLCFKRASQADTFPRRCLTMNRSDIVSFVIVCCLIRVLGSLSGKVKTDQQNPMRKLTDGGRNLGYPFSLGPAVSRADHHTERRCRLVPYRDPRWRLKGFMAMSLDGAEPTDTRYCRYSTVRSNNPYLKRFCFLLRTFRSINSANSSMNFVSWMGLSAAALHHIWRKSDFQFTDTAKSPFVHLHIWKGFLVALSRN